MRTIQLIRLGTCKCLNASTRTLIFKPDTDIFNEPEKSIGSIMATGQFSYWIIGMDNKKHHKSQ